MAKEEKSSSLTPTQLRLAESGTSIEMEPPESIAYQHTVFCQTGLPYKNPGETRSWERTNGQVSMRVEAGSAVHPQTGKFIQLGLPFGAKPRLVLIYLNSVAVKTRSPIIDVDRSLTAFVHRLRLDTGGRTIKTVKDQLTRLAAANVKLGTFDGERSINQQANIVQSFDLWLEKDVRQRVLWSSTIQLGDFYFESLLEHAVPLDERAIAALSDSALALDIYAWLAQRLRRIPATKPQFVHWPGLMEQLGSNYTRLVDFRRAFKKTLKKVVSQYPSARIELDQRGMTLKYSPSPIPERVVVVPDLSK